MPCAYIFLALALIGFPGLHANATQYVQWLSQTCLQLVFLPVISVGQAVLSKHAELQADEEFATTTKTYHELTQIVLHLEAQDAELLKQTDILLKLMQEKEKSV